MDSPWKRLLITASILSCWIQASSAQGDPVTVVASPPYGTVGGRVILDIWGFSGEALSYNWYRKTTENSNRIAVYLVPSGVQTPADIREKVFSNGSLLIPDLTFSDTDLYIVSIVDSNTSQSLIAQAKLAVYGKPAKFNFRANSTTILENGTVVFTCSPENEGTNILWFCNNQPLSLNERRKMSKNNQTLTIKSVKREDSGSYQCEVSKPIRAHRSDSLTLTVNYGPDHIVILPSPENGVIEIRFKDPLILVCHIESYPPALYEWQVNGTMNSDFSGNTIVIKSVSWEDSGKYTCLAKNNVTNLTISKDLTIRVVDTSPGKGYGSSLSGGAIAVIVIGVLVGQALIQTLLYFLLFRKTGRASKHHLSEKNYSAHKCGEDATMYENSVYPKGSALPAQGLGSSPAFPEVPCESTYQALDITTAYVYERIKPLKNPQEPLHLPLGQLSDVGLSGGQRDPADLYLLPPLSAFTLSCWIQALSAQGDTITVVPSPPYGTVGGSVILDILGFSREAVSYRWYRKTEENSNRIATYTVSSGEQTPADIREKVFSNGSLLIPDLTLSDTDLYIVAIFISSTTRLIRGAQLTVYDTSPGKCDDSSLSGGAIAGIVIGVLAGQALIQTLLYFLLFKKTGRASKHHLSVEHHSAYKRGEDANMYEHSVYPESSALPAQVMGSSPAPSESPYQELDINTAHVYYKIDPLKNPQA
ncbi:HEPACAM family member 2-like [Dromiciops gliroides]|uniref:HEPACAM family member 2-like n=1 Tax=Dromiciops gliroides TaxID=33562 RepID=UPI001CC6519C|nr:HEPACAM family member 2-like [Dromiciops gliroides]